MARIPPEEIQRLKEDISVERLAEARGVKLERHGADLFGLCPFHDDKEPSLVISPKKNLWHCLGACSAGGSVIDWVMRAEGVSFRHAVEILRAGAPAEVSVDKPKLSPVLAVPVEARAGDGELLEQVVSLYEEALGESPEALAYLESRGLGDGELIRHFRLGFSNRTLGYRLPPKAVKSGQEIRGRLQELGVLRSSGHEHLSGSLVVPVLDASGQVVELYGRKIGARLRKGTPLHLYLPGPHRGVFNLPALALSTEIILCESLLDALTFWAAGYRNVTACFGVNGLTEEIFEALRASSVERVLIAFDRDEAGDRAALKVAERLMAAGLACYRVRFPRGMDANEYAGEVTPSSKSLGVVLRKAEWMGEGQPEKAPSAPLVVGGSGLVGGTSDQGLEPQAVPIERTAKEEKSPSSPLAAALFTSPTSEGPEAPALIGASEPLASVVPSRPSEIVAEVSDHEVVIAFGDRTYRVRGLSKNLSYDVLKVNLLASRPAVEGAGFHIDVLDLYSARQRKTFVGQASKELGLEERLVNADVGKVLLKLEELQDEQIKKALEPQDEARVELSAEARAEALELLSSPDLLGRLLADFERCGVVGEETNKLVGYLASTSRLLDRPLAVVVQSSSAAGKSSLMEAVLGMFPAEHQVKYSAMTGQSLFYMGETNLSHKILAIVEEEGAERASYALKLLQSEGELTIASTGKDPSSGRLVTHEYRVEGPVMIFLTTTAIDVDEELLNRCLVLSVDEAREQTRAIHKLQRERRTLEGLLARKGKDAVIALHQNAQRLLRPLAVVNPFASELTFLDTQIRTRRDHEKYLTLIDSIALLHQYQRPVRKAEVAGPSGKVVEYVEVTLEDIATANRLAHEVLGRSLDELPPQTRRLLGLIDQLVAAGCERLGMDRSDYRFSRREVRESTGWGDTQLRLHLGRLVELEYLLVHQGGRGQSFVYELSWSIPDTGRPLFLPGLIEVESLGCDAKGSATTESSRGLEPGSRGESPDLAPPTRPQRAPDAGGSRSEQPLVAKGPKANFEASEPETAHLDPETNSRSVVASSRRSVFQPTSLV